MPPLTSISWVPIIPILAPHSKVTKVHGLKPLWWVGLALCLRGYSTTFLHHKPCVWSVIHLYHYLYLMITLVYQEPATYPNRLSTHLHLPSCMPVVYGQYKKTTSTFRFLLKTNYKYNMFVHTFKMHNSIYQWSIM